MPNPVRTNPLGQIADSVMEKLKDSGSSAAKAVVSEPAKILEQILGGTSQTDASGETAVEQGQQTQQQQQQADQALQMKRLEDEKKKQALIAQYHQKLQDEDKAHYAKRKQEEEIKKKQEEEQKQQKSQIVQLQKERENDEVWQQQIKAIQGSHEGQQGKM